MVADGNRLQVEVSHAVDLKLEGECGLQVSVDPVLYELQTKHEQFKHLNFRALFTETGDVKIFFLNITF